MDTSLEPRKSLPSIIAICAAIGSFFVAAGWAVLLCVVAVLLGVVGFVLAASPKIAGGILSLAAMAIGALGFIIALIRVVA